MDAVLAIDVGKTNLRVAVFTPESAPAASVLLERWHTAATDVPAALLCLQEHLRELGTRFHILRAGVSIFGPLAVDPAQADYGALVGSSDPAWSGRNVPALVSEALKRPVRFDFDVNCGALAEARRGAGLGADTFVYLSVGTGIGGVFCRGVPLAGYAPQMGHMLLGREPDDAAFMGTCRFHGGCLQGLASGRALEVRWGVPAERLAPDHAAWDLEARYLARACANFVYCFAPETIVLGSSVGVVPGLAERINRLLPTLLNDFMEPGLRTRYAQRPPVVRASLGADTSLLGAAEMALYGGGLAWPASRAASAHTSSPHQTDGVQCLSGEI